MTEAQGETIIGLLESIETAAHSIQASAHAASEAAILCAAALWFVFGWQLVRPMIARAGISAGGSKA